MTKSTTSTLVTLRWSELTNNKFRKALNPAMLTPEGHIETQKVQPRFKPKSYYIIKYDREYVVQCLAWKILHCLTPESFADLMDLIGDAYDYYKNNICKNAEVVTVETLEEEAGE